MKQQFKIMIVNSLAFGWLLTSLPAESTEQVDGNGKQDESHEIHDDHDAHEGHEGHEDHENELDHHHDHNEGVELSAKQMALANIEVAIVTPLLMDYQIYAPGEIKANRYTSYHVSPRVDSVVLRRHAALGDHVKKGQALVTLFSEAVADAQASFRVAYSEWGRVKGLGKKAVGAKRFISAQTDYEATYARLKVYGLSKEAIKSFSEKSQPLGEYTLIAETEGVVLMDDFHQGQRVGPSDALMELVDEDELWVEARLAATGEIHLPSGSEAKVNVGSYWYTAKVTQEAHTIDPQTRTRVVRLIVKNDTHRLHPGMFADVYFQFKTLQPIIAVPESALTRGANGDWTVFVQAEAGKFQSVEVDLGRSLGKLREIKGIKQGAKVVIKGAFFVASQIAKGGFDPHNH